MLYRKKPLVVQAFKWDGEKLDGRYPIELFKVFSVDKWHYGHAPGDGKGYELVIETLQGELTVEIGDYVIISPHDAYPCKPDIFEASYSLVETV